MRRELDYELLMAAIPGWLRDYARQAGATGYVIGLSGGIDSSLAAALAVRGVGRENVLGLLLPCHSQGEDADYARMAADFLGIETVEVVLDATYDALLAALPSGTALADANLKPRLRMAALYHVAQSRSALVLGTGNKSELMIGYFTKYGDGGVDVEPLGDLYKMEVRQLARRVGLPAPIIERPPTAGLWPGQTDEGELGITYDRLDAILMALEAGEEPAASPEEVALVKRLIARSEHKRRMPPVFKVPR